MESAEFPSVAQSWCLYGIGSVTKEARSCAAEWWRDSVGTRGSVLLAQPASICPASAAFLIMSNVCCPHPDSERLRAGQRPRAGQPGHTITWAPGRSGGHRAKPSVHLPCRERFRKERCGRATAQHGAGAKTESGVLQFSVVK